MVSQMLSTQWPLRIFIHCGRVFKLCITSILIWFSIIQFVMHNFSLRRSCFSPRVYIIQKLVFGLFSSSANQIKATYKYYFCQSKHKKANITAITIFGDAMSVFWWASVVFMCVSHDPEHYRFFECDLQHWWTRIPKNHTFNMLRTEKPWMRITYS